MSIKTSANIKNYCSKTFYNLEKLKLSKEEEHQVNYKMWCDFEKSLDECNDELVLTEIIKKHFWFSNSKRGTNIAISRMINKYREI